MPFGILTEDAAIERLAEATELEYAGCERNADEEIVSVSLRDKATNTVLVLTSLFSARLDEPCLQLEERQR